jgi:hypothetical protein
MDTSGDTLWTRKIGMWDIFCDSFWGQQTSDGGYIIVGYNYLGMDCCVYLVKLDVLGNTVWTRFFGESEYSIGRFVQQIQDGGYVITGQTNTPNQGTDIIFIKTNENGNVTFVKENENINKPNHFQLFQNYPNPFNPTTTIEYGLPNEAEVFLRIYDLKGYEVKIYYQGILSAGTHSVQWNGRNKFGNQVASGVYFYRLEAKTNEKTIVDVKKMIFMK